MLRQCLVGLFLVFGLFSLSFAKDTVFTKQGENMLVLTDESCVNKTIMQNVPEMYKEAMRRAWLRWEGRNVEACYMDYGSDFYAIVDVEGDGGLIDKSVFQPVPDPEDVKVKKQST